MEHSAKKRKFEQTDIDQNNNISVAFLNFNKVETDLNNEVGVAFLQFQRHASIKIQGI